MRSTSSNHSRHLIFAPRVVRDRGPAVWRRSRPAALGARLLAIFLLIACAPFSAHAQVSPADQRADAVLSEPASADLAVPVAPLSLPLFELVFRGGWLMVPIALMSVIVVAIGVERAIALRRQRVLPRRLETGLAEMAARNSFDPRRAAQLCLESPSNAARVAQAMLQRIGRPLGEIEHAIGEACQREADRLYSNVRTLHLATSVAPLLGLLGTVAGMIQAFFVTANMALGSNKGQALAEGIYVALVTTFAGLAVAIPAAVLAHVFETRILRLLRDIEHSVRQLLPQIDGLDGIPRTEHRHAAISDPLRPVAAQRPESKAS